MSSQPTQPETHPGQHPEHTQHYQTILHELIDMGADLARLVHQQALAQAAAQALAQAAATPGSAPRAEPAPDPTIPFDRIARAIRRTIILAQHLAEPVPPRAAQPGQHRLAARKRIIREVEDAIQRTPPSPKTETLHAELLDRLDGPDLDDDVAHRPTADIIADICRDLGLAAPSGTRPWKRRTPQDIAALCARARQLSFPAAAHQAAPFLPVSAHPPPPRTQTSTDPPDPAEPGRTRRNPLAPHHAPRGN